MAIELTKKQRGFVKDIIRTGNATKAADKNYEIESENRENVAGAIGSELLKKPKIREAMRLIKQERKRLSSKEIKLRDSILDSVMDKMEIEELETKEEDFYKYIYLMKCNEFYKIGIAVGLDDRLNQVQCGNPYLVSIVFGIKHKDAGKIEKELLGAFKNKKVRRDWFELDEKDILYIRNLIEGYGDA